MAITIVEKYVDIAGKHRARVTDGTYHAEFKFTYDPSNAELQILFDNYVIAVTASQTEQQADETDRKDILDYVYMYYNDPNSLTNNQKQTLLTRLCNRIVKRGIGL